VELLGDLVDRVDRAVERQRDPRDLGVLGRADGERVDVEPSPRKQAGDARQHTGLVLDRQRENVLAPSERLADSQVLELDEIRGAGLHQKSLI